MAKNKDNKIDPRIAHYDQESDVLYLGLRSGAEESFVEVAPGVNMEIGDHGKILGIEILNASSVLADIWPAVGKSKQAKAAWASPPIYVRSFSIWP